MKRLMIMALAAGSLAGQALAGRDISTVRDYVIRAAGKKTLEGIRAKKGGEKFLQTFLNDQDWLEQFAGSGRPGTFCPGPSDTPYAAALGWLASAAIGEPPLSVYWGWRAGDFPKGRFEQTVRYGVRRAFGTAGEYRIELTAKSGKSPKFDSIRLFIGKSEVARIDKMPFSVRISPAEAGKITSMVVRGEGFEDSTGTFSITRKILRDR